MNRLANQSVTAYSNMKAFFKRYANKVSNLDTQTQKKVVQGIIGLASANLGLSLFSLYTLASFALIALCFTLYIKTCFAIIRKKGLIAYLPESYQNALLTRSLFDILCDVWFMSDILPRIKATILPVLFGTKRMKMINRSEGVSPEEQDTSLIQEPSADSKTVSEKEDLLPSPHESEREDNISSDSEQNKIPSEQIPFINLMEDKEDAESLLELPELKVSKMVSETSDSQTYAKGKPMERFSSMSTTDDDSVFGNSSSFSRLSKSKRTSICSTTSSRTLTTQLTKSLSSSLEEKSINKSLVPVGRDISPLNGSKKTRVIVSKAWTTLNLFVRKQNIQRLKHGKNIVEFLKKVESEGLSQVAQNMLTDWAKQKMLSKLEEKTLIKIFLVSSLGLLFQFSMSKKSRYWCYLTLQILIYIASFTLSAGSVSLLLLKMKMTVKKWKEVQNTNTHGAIRREHESDTK